jgi:hypothetical protein
MDITKKLAHAADKFNHSPRKKSYVALDQKSSSEEYETSVDSRYDCKASSSSPIPHHRPASGGSSQGGGETKKTKKKSKKREPTTIEEDLASTGYSVSPKMLAVANVSKKRNELVMLNYLNALSEQLFAQEQAIQLMQIQLREMHKTQRRRELQEAQRKLEEEARRHQESPNNAISRLFSKEDSESCTLF